MERCEMMINTLVLAHNPQNEAQNFLNILIRMLYELDPAGLHFKGCVVSVYSAAAAACLLSLHYVPIIYCSLSTVNV